MGSTLSLGDFEKFSDNIYEAIIIIARRARQINDEQKLVIDQVTGAAESDNEDDEDKVDMYQENSELNFPKPTQQALQEFLEGKLNYDYGDEE